MPSLDDAYAAAESQRLSLLHRARNGDRSPAVMAGGATASNPILNPTDESAVHTKQYEHNTGWVHSAVRLIAQRGAGQPVHVGRRRTKGSASSQYLPDGRAIKDLMPTSLKDISGEVELQDNHPLLDVLDDPNPIMTRWALLFVTLASLELTGKAYWWIFEGGEDGRLWTIMPLPASWVKPIHKKGKLYHSWEISPKQGEEPLTVPGDEIAYIYYPDPGNPLGAISPLQAQSRAVSSDEAQSEAQRRAFLKGLNPGYAITVGRLPDATGAPGFRPHLTDAQKAQLIGVIKNAYRGVANYDEPIILDGWIDKIEKVSHTPREMDFIQSGKATKSRITQGFGVNPVVMGELEGANRATSYTADDIFCRVTVNPKLDMVSQCLTAWVAPRFARKGERLLVWLEPAQATDPEFQLQVEKVMLTNCPAVTFNEMRQKHGMPPYPGGDFIWVPNQLRAVRVADLAKLGTEEEINNAINNSQPNPTPDPVSESDPPPPNP